MELLIINQNRIYRLAYKAGVFCSAIDLNFRLTESWGESKNDSKGEVEASN